MIKEKCLLAFFLLSEHLRPQKYLSEAFYIADFFSLLSTFFVLLFSLIIGFTNLYTRRQVVVLVTFFYICAICNASDVKNL